MNSSPVVGLDVLGWPGADVAESSSVLTVSAVLHELPTFGVTPRHSARIVGVPINTVPVRSTPAGRRIV